MSVGNDAPALKSVAILGCGGFAREVLWCAEHARFHECGGRLLVAGFVDKIENKEGFQGLPVWSLGSVPGELEFVCGIGGMPELKERACAEAEALGLRPVRAFLWPSATVGPRVAMGRGSIVCAGNILTSDITLGRHVAINLACTVGHDSVLEDHVTVSPGVNISGRVHVERGAFLGTGASIIEGVRIGARAVVGAGAVVTRDVPPRSLVAGVPAAIKRARRVLACPLASCAT